MLASVRFNSGGSGGFVSRRRAARHQPPRRGRRAAEAQQARAKTYSATASTPDTRDEELKCPDLELNVLQEIIDVTERGERGREAGDDAGRGVRRAPGGDGRRSRRSRSTRPGCVATWSRSTTAGCTTSTATRSTPTCGSCSPRSRRSPSSAATSTTSSTRGMNLDVASSAPTRTASRRRRRTTSSGARPGPTEGDLVFVTGHPGTTQPARNARQAQAPPRPHAAVHARPAAHAGSGAARSTASSGPRSSRQAATDLHRVANARKAFSGQYQGLLDPKIIDAEAKAERTDRESWRRARGRSDPGPARIRGDDDRAVEAHRRRSQDDARASFEKAVLPARTRRTPSTRRLFGIARHCVRMADELPKKSADRLREYRDSNLESLKFQLFSPAPIYPELERAKLTGVAHVPGREPRRRTPDW